MATSITVRYFAGAKAAAGTDEEEIEAGGAGGTLEELLAGLAGRHGDALDRVLGVASFLVDGAACRDRQARLPAGCTVDVLPPFAGG
jgi:molybdopterin synthase sulfur carrier subunit